MTNRELACAFGQGFACVEFLYVMIPLLAILLAFVFFMAFATRRR